MGVSNDEEMQASFLASVPYVAFASISSLQAAEINSKTAAPG